MSAEVILEERRIAVLALSLAAILGVLSLFSWAVALLSGWRRLAASYGNDSPFEADQWRFSQGVVWRLPFARLNVTLRVGADRRFLYLRTWPLRFPGFQELRVPWPEVSMRERRIAFWKFCVLRFEKQPRVAIQMKESAAQQALASAGGEWREGRPEFPG